ncbi:MAG: Ldh family oxidoreductase, partial [Gemmatimonadetes bacterium]|nr:Ldh family oxidoreductase [Gemmatimonadota bacterium]
MTHRYAVTDLITFATEMLSAAGLDRDKAGVVAATLVEGDLLGHDTHGLQLLGPYLTQLHAGLMAGTGEPEVVADRGGCVTWNGRRLPGAWLVHRALDLAVGRGPRLGVVTVVIRHSHHIGCLAAYLRRATDENLAVLLMSSEPSSRCVAPFGGTRPV